MNFLKLLGFAVAGLAEMIINHNNFRLQIIIGAIAVITGFFFKLNVLEWMFLALAGGLVLVAEMANSAVEFVVDLITKERKSEAKKAKDIAAGMVLLASGISMVIGILLFGPRLIKFL
jgi:undecaprenol kinase/diacylglycerol kinase (ATP)